MFVFTRQGSITCSVILSVRPLPVAGGMCVVTEAVGRCELSRASQGQVYAAAAPEEDFAQTPTGYGACTHVSCFSFEREPRVSEDPRTHGCFPRGPVHPRGLTAPGSGPVLVESGCGGRHPGLQGGSSRCCPQRAGRCMPPSVTPGPACPQDGLVSLAQPSRGDPGQEAPGQRN